MRRWFGRRMAPDLRAELARQPDWMYPWPIAGAQRPTLLDPELESVHRTRSELIEPAVREALAKSERPGAIDLACSEGCLAHRLLEWGASYVAGLDIREQNIRRARLMRDHFGISADELIFKQANVNALPFAPGRRSTWYCCWAGSITWRTLQESFAVHVLQPEGSW